MIVSHRSPDDKFSASGGLMFDRRGVGIPVSVYRSHRGGAVAIPIRRRSHPMH